MADKSFGVKELNLLNASGTPTVTSPNNLNLNANTVAISTSCTIGNNLTVTGGTSLSNLLVSGITTFTAGNTVDVRGNFTVSGISTIPKPADSNPMANWTITNNSASAYRFTGPGQSGTEDNPNIYLVRGHRYIFEHNATSSHPIQIRFANGGTAYTDGVTYSDTSNNRTTDGNNLIFNVQHDAPAQLFYQCTSHGGMVGNIYIVGGPQVISGVVTATTFVGNLTGNVTGTASANAVLTGSTNNQLVTVTGANAITGESALTFDGSTLNLTSASGDARVTLIGTEGNDARLSLVSDDGDDHIDQYNLRVDASDNSFFIDQFESGSFIQRFRIANGGKIVMGNSTTSTTQLDIRFTDTTAYSATDNRPNGLKIFNDSNTDNGFAGIELGATDGDDYYGSTLLKSIADGTNYSNDFVIQTRHSGNYAERLRIHSDGKIVIGSSAETSTGLLLLEKDLTAESDVSDKNNYHLVIRSQTNSNTSAIGIAFANTSDDTHVGAAILHHRTSTDSVGDLAFYTSPSSGTTTERMRINKDGTLFMGKTSQSSGTAGIELYPDGPNFMTRNGTTVLGLNNDAGTNGDIMRFYFQDVHKGSLNFSSGSFSATTASDYRLKENDTPITDGIARVKKLKPIRFNFKENPSETLDGFFAHELQEVVPDCVTGEKDGEISERGEGYQCISKEGLVPLLTASIKDLIAKVETLEAEVAALKGS